MRNPLVCKTTKNTSCVSIAMLLLFASMVLMFVSKPVGAAELTTISLNPSTLEVPAPGANFTIDVNITDVANMQGYEFKLGFNTTLLNATGVTQGPMNPLGTTLGPVDPDTFEWTPLQNVSDGFVWVIAVLPLGQAFTGNGTTMTINFTALSMGNSTLDLFDTVLGHATVVCDFSKSIGIHCSCR